MRARALRFVAAFQVLLLLFTLVLPGLAAATEPDPSASAPAPTEPTTTPDPGPTADPTQTYVPSGPPTISSDKADYAPGELVTLTGANWAAGESVHIYVNDELGSSWSRNVYVVASESGDLTDEFNLPNWFVANYVVVATGASSGVALASFTDAINTTTTVTSSLNPSNSGNSVTFTGTVTCSAACTFPSGSSVDFKDGANNGCNGGTTLGSTSTLSGSGNSRTATLATSTLSVGLHSIRACFNTGSTSGNNAQSSVSDPPLTQTVNGGDTTAPDTSITANPSNPSSSSSASFSFTGTDDVTAPASLTFECKLDAGAFAACTSPKAYAGLAEGSHTFQVRAIDGAGNVDGSPASFTWTVDTIAPVITATATNADNSTYTADTWTNQSVTVAFTCSDGGGSGLSVNSVPGDGGTQDGDTATGSFTAAGTHCVDNAGNAATTVEFGPIKVDKTAPVILDEGPTTSANGNDWYNHDVDNEFSVTDNLSGIDATCDAAFGEPSDFQTKTTFGEGLAVYVTSDGCTDLAGNAADPVNSDTFQIDATAPVATVHIDDTPNGAGWFNSTVHFSTTGLDNLSGIASCTDAADYSGPDGNPVTSASATCTDNAGNVSAADVSDAFKYDATAPVITNLGPTPSSPNGLHSWYTVTVSNRFYAADATSGLSASCLAAFPDPSNNQDKVTSAEGSSIHTTSDSCSDVAGNTAAAINSANFKIDLNDPSVAISSPSASFITVLSTITVGATASDTLIGSGIGTVSVNGVPAAYAAGLYTASNVPLNCGANTFTALATDLAGRTKTATSSVTVTRICVGGIQYYQPIDQSTTSTPVINTGKFGRVIPVKVTATYDLGLGNVNLTDTVMAANGLTMRLAVVGTNCGSAATIDTVEAYADAGSSNGGTNLFRWTTSQWVYNLDTGNAPSLVMAVNGCYRLDVWINDSYGGTTRLSGGPTGIGNYAIFKPIR